MNGNRTHNVSIGYEMFIFIYVYIKIYINKTRQLCTNYQLYISHDVRSEVCYSILSMFLHEFVFVVWLSLVIILCHMKLK